MRQKVQESVLEVQCLQLHFRVWQGKDVGLGTLDIRPLAFLSLHSRKSPTHHQQAHRFLSEKAFIAGDNIRHGTKEEQQDQRQHQRQACPDDQGAH